MPWTNNPTIDAFRRKYNVAIGVHQAAARALVSTRASGEAPSREIEEAEATARAELALARDQLLAAVTSAITGQVEAQLRSRPPPDSDATKTS
jgi:hypothetical protein